MNRTKYLFTKWNSWWLQRNMVDSPQCNWQWQTQKLTTSLQRQTKTVRSLFRSQSKLMPNLSVYED